MSFDFSGFVLRAPRTAPANALTTDEAVNGVERDHKPVPDSYQMSTLVGEAPDLVELAADQYRCSTLLRSDDGQTEYAMWAANTADISTLVGTLVFKDEITILSGNVDVSVESGEPDVTDPNGTLRIAVTDKECRSIATVITVRIDRGDTNVQVVFGPNDFTFNPTTSILVLTNEFLITQLGGGISSKRGDKVGADYTLAAVRFWWSKNDRYETRFQWDGQLQRWAPLKGTPPRNLGKLLADTDYTLDPAPSVTVGQYLPGDSADTDSYSMVRLGVLPSASSVPVAQPVDPGTGFGGILVVTDEEADEEEIDFSLTPTLSGVIGQSSGKLRWNPSYVDEFAGQTIFYSYRSFLTEGDTESLGQLEGSDTEPLFLAPLPGPTDYPFIRIGSRNPLEALLVDTEATLAILTVEEGQVGVTLSTGRLKFSDADIAKATPSDPTFDPTYLGNVVFYDGVSLTQVPLSMKAPVALVNTSGQAVSVGKKQRIFVPDAVPLPSPGVSGVQFVPDRTGTIPNTDVNPEVRSAGSGLLRDVRGSWDVILFGKSGEISTVRVVDDPEDIPKFPFQIPRGTAYLNLNEGPGGSEITLGKEDIKKFSGERLWFLQSAIQPAVWQSDARIFSRVRDNFDLTGTEVLKFSIEADVYVWDASTNPGGVETSSGGTFSATEIATSLNAVVTGIGDVVAQSGRVVIRSGKLVNGIYIGRIEIGWGPGTTRDLSGPAAFGFLPGWRIQRFNPEDPSDIHWLPDSGINLGVFNSPLGAVDIKHQNAYENIVLQKSIGPAPVVILDRVPLEDEPGYDDGVFFRVQDGLTTRNLVHYENILHQFGLRKFTWLDDNSQFTVIEQPTADLQMENQQVIPDSFRIPSKGLRVSEKGGPFVTQDPNTDFVMPFDGAPGIVKLIDVVSDRVALGGRGFFTAGGTTFEDPSADIDFVDLGVLRGYQLKVGTGSAKGTYTVTADATLSKSLEVEPIFLHTDSTVSWELFDGVGRDTFDPGIVADQIYTEFNHLLTEPFKIRVLSPLGDMPANATAQKSNRLVAVLSDAISSNRPIAIRFGLPFASDTGTLRRLTQTNLGVVINSALDVPNTNSERFANDNFSIRVGTKTYKFTNGDLIKVTDLTFGLTGDVIEVRDSDGLLNFGVDVFTQFSGSEAYYVEEFLDPDLSPTELPQGTVEYNIETGALNFSSPDIGTYVEQEIYFVEQMVTEQGLDVTLNPIQGSFLFNKPLREFQIVEADYFQAEVGSGELVLQPAANFIGLDGQDPPLVPVKVIERLPLFVRQEIATKPVVPPNNIVPAQYNRTWLFNPTERTLREDVPTQIYMGVQLCNVGGAASPIATVDGENNAIIFQDPFPDDSVVQISYAVEEAFGGEQSYTVSTIPVYRPPFFIEADKEQFALEGNRTGDVLPGKLLRMGGFMFYITDSTFDGENTTVKFFPETSFEAGSRAPGNDMLTLLSGDPIADQYNPVASIGLWEEITDPYEPINAGFTSFTFLGDQTEHAVEGHLIEIGGLPFTIAGVELSAEGSKTKIDITSASPTGFAFGFDIVRITVRPIYPPAPTQFMGLGPVLAEDDFEAVLFGEKDVDGNLLPGRTLKLSTEYTIDLDSGAIEFLAPNQGPLAPSQTLFLRHTAVRVLSPFIQNEVIVTPRFIASYAHVANPGEINVRAKILRAKYTFSAPDTWFFRTAPLLDILVEVAATVAAQVAALLPSQGSGAVVQPAIVNHEQGNLGLRAQISDLEDQDRAARVFLEFYNETILAFEQVLEAISGAIIGDRDGKFKFFIGHGKEYPPPGYEDEISGDLNVRNVFAELFFAFNRHIVMLPRDALVNPVSATLVVGQLIGQFLNPDALGDLIQDQRELIANDVDDLVLIGSSRKRLRFNPLRLESFGRYRLMGQPSRFSRIFPERAEAFTLTDPGIEADLEADPIKPGVYAFRKKVQKLSFKGGGIQFPKRASTFRKPIAQIENPVLGQIENIASINVRERQPRARVFAYSETGFPELDTEIALAGGTTFASQPRPAIIATVLPLQDFPISDNGLPDVDQLIAQGGGLPDLSTGDPELFTPPFETIDTGNNFRPMLSFGRPTGEILDAAVTETLDIAFLEFSSPVLKKIFVGEVLLGCIVTIAKDDESIITDPESIVFVGEEPEEADPFSLKRGDTVFVTPPDADISAADPPTNEERDAAVSGLPGYRIGFDVRVDRAEGEFTDFSWPSFKDPSIFGLKEVFGQNPPRPLDHLEADVTFRNGNVDPTVIPALVGGDKNDSGDYSLPYLVAPNTELDRLGEAAKAFQNLIAVDSPVPNAVFPDEIVGVDGQVYAIITNGFPPASLITAQDALPVTTDGGIYTPGSGVGDVQEFDFLFVQTGQVSVPLGSQGILGVGAVASGSSIIEPPRFVTPTQKGKLFRYTFDNIMTFVNKVPPPGGAGMVVAFNAGITTFDVSSISQGFIVLNDGAAVGSVGGLNDIVNPGPPFAYASAGNTNIIKIDLYTPDDGINPPTFLQTVELRMNGLSPEMDGDIGTETLLAQPTWGNQVFTTSTALPYVTISNAPAPGELPEDPNQPGQTIPLWFTISVDVSTGASLTGRIRNDRLTFEESYDLRSVLPRDEPQVDSRDVHGKLAIVGVTGAGVVPLTVNNPAEVNGGAPFTFLARNEFFPFIGAFDFPPTSLGTIKAMAFEGWSNSAIQSNGNVSFSAIPSSAQDVNGVICNGRAIAESVISAVDTDNRVSLYLLGGGAVNNVLPGDILTITGDGVLEATTKAGTYLVKHAIEANDVLAGTNTYHAAQTASGTNLVTKTSPINTGSGWAQVQFPRLVAYDFDAVPSTITLTNATLADGTTSAWPTPAAGTRLYLLKNLTDIETVVSVEYTSVNLATGVFEVDTTTFWDHAGALITENVFLNGTTLKPAQVIQGEEDGTVLSGFMFIDIRMDQAGAYPALPRSVVGSLGDGTVAFNAAEPPASGTAFGFLGLQFDNTPLAGTLGPFNYAAGGGATKIKVVAALETTIPNEIGILDAPVVNNGQFNDDPDAVVYPNVPGTLDLSGLTSGTAGDWHAIHGAGAGIADEVNCLWPTDSMTCIDSGGRSGFRAQAGIFLEPSIPRPVANLASALVADSPRLVDSGNALTAAGQIGFRDGPTFGAGITPELVTFEVRRIRRFHEQLDKINDILFPMRYVYQTRRGTATLYGTQVVEPAGLPYPFVLQADGSTQLGGFTSEDVNINPGDLFRLLDGDGKLLEEVEIVAIESDTLLLLRAPGITVVNAASVTGLPFEIYLRKAPAPHEQSNAQLLDLLTDEVLLDRTADFGAQTGGLVPMPMDLVDPRTLADTDLSINFASLGIQDGDIVLIDPVGLLQGPTGLPATGQERAVRPFGDRSVPNRVIATAGQEVPFIAGGPSELDDNRGFYRITEVGSASVTVSGENTFAGLGSSPVTFGTETEYAVYPTVSNSGGQFADPPGAGTEGQMELRPTSLAGTNGSPVNSFSGNLFSIAPFSYRIFRPSPLFSDEAIDLILMMRERTLSFIEEFDAIFQGRKSGTYFVFQRDRHCSDLGNPLIPDDGLGVMSNALITGVQGEVEISPFANTTDGLSVLDRRFWALDTRLDGERPPGTVAPIPTYSAMESNDGIPSASVGDGRPVLPDFITDVLDNNDQFRPLRFAWLEFRVNREEGTLVTVRRFENEFSKRRRRQIRQLKQAESANKVGS